MICKRKLCAMAEKQHVPLPPAPAPAFQVVSLLLSPLVGTELERGGGSVGEAATDAAWVCV